MKHMVCLGSARVVSLCLVLAGCGAHGASVQFVATNAPPSPVTPRSARDVSVYAHAAPQKPHAEIGMLTVEENGAGSASTEALVDKLRDRAGDAGCDAIILEETTGLVEGVQGGTARAMGGRTWTRRGYRATCIVFLPS